MVPIFITAPPIIEMEDGLVHVRWVDDRDSYWKPSTFRAFVNEGAITLDLFERRQQAVIAMCRKR